MDIWRLKLKLKLIIIKLTFKSGENFELFKKLNKKWILNLLKLNGFLAENLLIIDFFIIILSFSKENPRYG